MKKHTFLHEGGHGHEGCCGGHGEGCCHGHERKEISPEQTVVLMSYMLDHNRSHEGELGDIAAALKAQGKGDAAALLEEAVHYFGHCNEKLEAALKNVKGE